jgi:hypothetical protein
MRSGVERHVPPSAGPPILLLCREPRLRALLRLALQAEGYTVRDGIGPAAPPPPTSAAAVVVDLDSLDLQPAGTVAALAAAGVADATPLLLISVYPLELVSIPWVGPTAYLQPPFAPRELARRVGRVLGAPTRVERA